MRLIAKADRKALKWLPTYFNFWKKRRKIRKRAAKHFEGLPIVVLFFGNVATTSGHFVHKSEHKTRDGGLHIRPVCC